jgi:hypothetical protein
LALGLVLALLAAAMVAVRGAHLAVGLGVAACLVVIARANGFTAAELGLARSTWRTGLRWGAAAAALVAAAYALAYLIPAARHVLPEGGGGIGRAALWTVLVVIPLGRCSQRSSRSVACCCPCWVAGMACLPRP